MPNDASEPIVDLKPNPAQLVKLENQPVQPSPQPPARERLEVQESAPPLPSNPSGNPFSPLSREFNESMELISIQSTETSPNQ